MSILKNVPLNTKKVYVMGKTHNGCEVYLPVDSYDDNVIIHARDTLREELKNQPITDDFEPILA